MDFNSSQGLSENICRNAVEHGIHGTELLRFKTLFRKTNTYDGVPQAALRQSLLDARGAAMLWQPHLYA